MIQLIIAIKDLIKSTNADVSIITKVGTYVNIKDIKLSNDKQIVDIVYDFGGKIYDIECRVKDINSIICININN